MKTLLTFCLLVPAFATAHAEEDFAAHKAQAVAGIEERIQKMQEHKNCVSSASDRAAFQACHKGMKEWREGERTERREKRMGRMEERKKKMEEREKH